MFVPCLNSTITEPRPSAADDSVRFSPSTDWICSSILRTIDSSTS